MKNELSYRELQNKLAELRAEGKTAEANDLEIWIDYRLDQARETAEAVLDVMNEGSVRHV